MGSAWFRLKHLLQLRLDEIRLAKNAHWLLTKCSQWGCTGSGEKSIRFIALFLCLIKFYYRDNVGIPNELLVVTATNINEDSFVVQWSRRRILQQQIYGSPSGSKFTDVLQFTFSGCYAPCRLEHHPYAPLRSSPGPYSTGFAGSVP